MQPFPLYDELSAIKTTDIPDPGKLSILLNKLEKDKREIVMALIYHHAIMTKVFNQDRLVPYEGKMFGGMSGISMKIKDLPNDLVRILWIYVTV